MNRTPKAFTLIELLVVIAIIGLLSGIVLQGLALARGRASDASVQQQMGQLRNVFAKQLNDTGSYAGIKTGGGWKAVGAACSAGSFSGPYAAEAKTLCDALVKSTGNACGNYCVYFQTAAPNDDTHFSIMAYLPGASASAGSVRYLCMGSSGNVSVSTATTWTEPGCYQNP